jgi:hypothetical protein
MQQDDLNFIIKTAIVSQLYVVFDLAALRLLNDILQFENHQLQLLKKFPSLIVCAFID